MKKLLLFICTATVVTLSAAVPDSSWSIVISGKGSDAEKRFDRIAADLLKKGLKHLTGADLKITYGAKKSAKAIFVGRHADPQKFENKHWQGRFRTDKAGNWYFAGSSRSIFHMAKSSNHRFHEAGIIRCVVLFLREYAGFRAVLPGARYRYFSKKKSVDFPKNFVINYDTPAISYCNGRNTNDPVYDLSNGYLPGVWYFTYGGHSHPVAVPLSVYDKHPEYFILTRANKRWRGKQYCISNPGFQELVYKEMCRKVDAGYEWVQLAQTDGFGLCRCKNCQAYGNTGDAGEKIWILHRKLAERFHRERPGKKVVILCYHPNSNPPKAFNTFPPNVIIETSRYREADFAAWKNIKLPGGFVTYVYNWGLYHAEGYSPKFTPSYGIAQLKTFRQNNVKGIYRCGGCELPGLEGASYYAYGAALLDPSITVEKAMDEFCRGALPENPGVLKKFFDRLHQIIEKDGNKIYTDLHRINAKRMPGGYGNHYLYSSRYSEKNLAELDALLKKCEAVSPKGYPAIMRREFDLIRHTARMSRAYIAHLKNPDFGSLQRLEKAVSARSDYIRSMPIFKNRFSFVAGLSIFAMGNHEKVITGGSGRGRFVYPVSWPWKQLMAYKIVPGARTVKTDGKEHRLLPGLMEQWELDGRFSVTRQEKGVLFTIKAPMPAAKAADFFYINLPGCRFIFRCGGGIGATRYASYYPQLPNKNPAAGERFGRYRRCTESPVKRIDKQTYTLFIPWKYLTGGKKPAAGKAILFNVSFRRQSSHNFKYLTFEPDLKFLNERGTWSSGRGKLIF